MSILTKKPLKNPPSGKSAKYADVVNNVYSTTNYELFSHVRGNRNILLPHLKRLTASIAERNIPVPIIVDELYRICDVQHRYEAYKSLGLPIPYMIVPELSLEDIQRLNANMRTWGYADYLSCYCDLEHPNRDNYLLFREFRDKYGFNWDMCMVLLADYHRTVQFKSTAHDESKRLSEVFKDGEFEVRGYKRACQYADDIMKVKKYYDGYRRRSFVLALRFLFKNPEYDHNLFLKKLSQQTEKMIHQVNQSDYLKLIERIYNFRCRDKVRLFSY